jgi:hypothetical protein
LTSRFVPSLRFTASSRSWRTGPLQPSAKCTSQQMIPSHASRQSFAWRATNGGRNGLSPFFVSNGLGDTHVLTKSGDLQASISYLTDVNVGHLIGFWRSDMGQSAVFMSSVPLIATTRSRRPMKQRIQN